MKSKTIPKWSSLALAVVLAGNSVLPVWAVAVKVGAHDAFAVDAPVGALTAAQRVKIMQKNVDNALVASSDKSPEAVSITSVNGQPVLTLGGFYVASADPNTAKKLGITKMAVAQRWQAGLRKALANPADVQSYLANLTGGGKGPQAGTSTTASGSFPYYKSGQLVYVPAGMMLPVVMQTPLSSDTARAGDPIEATLAQAVVLGDSALPMETVLRGVVTEAAAGTGMSHSGALGMKFTNMQLPGSQNTPIQAHIVGRLGNYEQRDGAVDTFKGESTNHKIEDALIRGGIGAGGGAIMGTVIGAIAGRGRGAGRGALAGLSIGSALGVADSLLLRKGSNVKVGSGQALNLQLDAPASIEAASAAYVDEARTGAMPQGQPSYAQPAQYAPPSRYQQPGIQYQPVSGRYQQPPPVPYSQPAQNQYQPQSQTQGWESR